MQRDKRQKMGKEQLLIFGAVALIVLTGGGFLPAAIIGYVIYMAVKKSKNGEKQNKMPLSSSQKSEKRQQARSGETPQPRPVQPQAPRPKAANHTVEQKRFVSVTTDYGARHRENARRLFEAGLMEKEEYTMQIQRSKTM